MSDGVVTFRDALLEAHERIQEKVEELRDRTERVGQPRSRNPTAFSTLPKSRAEFGGTTRYSTVPAETRYSSAPNHARIYGRRFRGAIERDA